RPRRQGAPERARAPPPLPAPRARGKRAAGGAARPLAPAVLGPDLPEPDQTPLPAAVLAVGERDGDEVVAVRDRGEEPPDVPAFPVRRGEGGSERHGRERLSPTSR